MINTCTACGKVSTDTLSVDARGKPVCSGCCSHDFAWGKCKFCGRSWGMSEEAPKPKSKEDGH